ncbi:hypothetical protein E4T56_gene6089 [Termitomyces sp. T112]|nr:hypothetical protein E4T56_gene6089 [Termitomyces sp. T112]
MQYCALVEKPGIVKTTPLRRSTKARWKWMDYSSEMQTFPCFVEIENQPTMVVPASASSFVVDYATTCQALGEMLRLSVSACSAGCHILKPGLEFR